MTENFDLQWFAEGGAAGGAEGGVAEAAGGTADVAQAQGAQPQPQTRVTASTAEERRAAFDELVEGEWKDEYTRRMQGVEAGRVRAESALREQQTAMQPLLDALSSKYGVDGKDLGKLLKAIDEDDSYYANEAEEKGLTVEQLKAFKRMERENEQLKQAQMAQAQRAQAESVYSRWQQESDSLKQVYPGFDLRTEAQNPQTGESFVKLLRNGVDVKTAYEVIHKDELLSGAIGYAVQSAQKRTMQTIQARGMRPQENGAGGSVGTQVTKSDPSRWSKADRREVNRRVLRGERIEL